MLRFPDQIGCADGTREGFDSIVDYPGIAACAGQWNQPGIDSPRTGSSCSGGFKCAAVDLCAPTWEICADHLAVASHGASACDEAARPGFYATGQRSTGNLECIDGLGSNDLFGCDAPFVRSMIGSDCAPLNGGSGDGCDVLGPPWQCVAGANERDTVVKTADASGGVLCCKQ